MPLQPASFPSLYQLNTRVFLTQLSESLGRKATLTDIPDEALNNFAQQGFQWIWPLSVWQTGIASPKISRSIPELLNEFKDTLPDLTERDIAGSGFAIYSYEVHHDLGGNDALASLRARLTSRGIKLMLDFVPNHVAIDHPWINEHSDYIVSGTEEQLNHEPNNYVKLQTANGEKIFAHGRDPYFPGWTDTLQLDYSNPALQQAMMGELVKIASMCDGVRCDMAMLILPEVFQRTWGKPCTPFWPVATKRIHDEYPAFIFMAEVYWDLEWTLQQQGFTYTYDKCLYDRLRDGDARAVRSHFQAEFDFQVKCARFLENHDEPRAARTFATYQHEAAALLTFFCPGLRFFHQGQFEGKLKKISPHLIREPIEAVDSTIKEFYNKLLAILKQPIFHMGGWQLLWPLPVCDGNSSCDHYIGFAWWTPNEKVIIVVNYSSSQSQCFMRIPFPELAGQIWNLKDQFSAVTYEREGNELLSRGLYLDEPGWKYYLFSIDSC
jgi:hypothetical protein